MSEKFTPLSDLLECDDLEKSKKNHLNISDFSRFELWKFDEIEDSDLQWELKRVEEACKESSTNRLMLLQEMSASEKLLYKDEKNISNNNELISGEIIYTVEKKWETLWEIIQKIYGLEKWSVIAKKLKEVYSNNIWLTENIQPWDKIILKINDTDEYIKRQLQIWQDTRDKDLKNIEEARLQNISELNNVDSNKTPIITAELDTSKYQLDNNKFSWALNNDAFEIFKNMKNTKWEQVIWKYRNKDWEVENIVLWDNKWKNIYMELDDSYTWDDIDSWKIDNISSQEELENIMKKLLKKYETENREEYNISSLFYILIICQ